MDPVENYRDAVTSRDREVYGPAALELRRWMAANDPHWPRYHLLGPESWTNDANGPIYYQGRYHMFYQFDPIVNGRQSARTWAHAVSDDLVHWKDWPVALWPDTPYDRNGVYSGNTFVLNDGSLGALYTGNVDGHRETYGIFARSVDAGLTWTKKMVMNDSERPNSDSPVHWDGQVWRDGDLWYQLIGGTTGGNEPRGAAWLWASPNLEHWTLQGNIAPTIESNGFWELPYLIPLGGRHVMMVGQGNPYWIGNYDRKKTLFTPYGKEPHQFDTGNYYAVNPHMVDDKGPAGSERRLLHAWVTGPPSTTDTVPYWQGALALPRVLTLEGDRVRQEPIPELQSLRGRHQRFEGSVMTDQLRNVRGDTLELRATFINNGTDRFGLKLRVSDDGSDFVRVFYDADRRDFGVDGPTVDRNARDFQEGLLGIKLGRQASFLEPGAPVTLHVFLDRSIVEVFVNGCAYTARAFSDPAALGVDLWFERDSATLDSLDVWELSSIWEN